MDISKELYISAPYPGVAVYAQSQCYLTATGPELVESVRYEAPRRDRTRPGLSYYSDSLFRRISRDNGTTWAVVGDVYREDPEDTQNDHMCTATHFRDPDSGLILSLVLVYDLRGVRRRETFSDEGILGGHKRMSYQVSRDQGLSWEPLRPVIHSGDEYGEGHWGPGLYYGRNGGGGDMGRFIKLADGTILTAFVVNLEDGKRYQSVFLRGRWRDDLSGLDWEFSDYISVSADKSSQGCCEPMPAMLDDGRIFVSLRCCGDREHESFPSLKYWVISDDGARSFSEPVPLTYEDGSPAWSPSSWAGILRSSVDGRFYWIGNILDRPTYSAYPRYPLCIAELIPEKGCLRRDSVTVIDTLPDDWPEGLRERRYTNFGFYEDRQTREVVVTLPEQPKTSWEDFTSDCMVYRVTV